MVMLFFSRDNNLLSRVVDTTISSVGSGSSGEHELHNTVLLILHVSHVKELLSVEPLFMNLILEITDTILLFLS